MRQGARPCLNRISLLRMILKTGSCVSVLIAKQRRGARMRAKSRAKAWLAATAAWAAGASVAHAEDDGAAQFELAQAVTVIGERPRYGADASASPLKIETPLRDTPQAVTIVTRELIEDAGLRSMADVVRYAPGVTMGQGEGHRDAPTLRGNSSTADFFVDGGRDDVQYYRDLYNSERIEILTGPNAMIFGRGGGGGVINRVTKSADGALRRAFTLQTDTDGEARAEIDLGGALSDAVSLRLNAMAEDSESYRDFVSLRRSGINPAATLRLSPDATLQLSYEHFEDERTVDRGVPSLNGRPARLSASAFVGNPALSFGEADVDALAADLRYALTPSLRLHSRLVYAEYGKHYQNVHAGAAVDALGNIRLQAYASDTARENLFSQNDLIWEASTGTIDHTILIGAEFGRQDTSNTRTPTDNAVGFVTVANPTTFAPVAFLSPLQTDNAVRADIAAIYVQDQIALSDAVRVIAGLRYDRFDLEVDDRRAGAADFSRTDDLVSPRLGLVYKPIEPVSLYASYSVSYLPQSGDQFASLNATTAALEPEEFENIEVGVKWDITPGLAFTAALYRLDRTNTRAVDPITNLTVLTGAQRSEGLELSLTGAITPRWDIIAGYGYQDVSITRDTASAPSGRLVALTPEHIFSVWNSYQASERISLGLGIAYQGESFASISNAVTLPAFTRVDAAITFAITDSLDAQINVENLFDETYWPTAHNDNNITPGAPRLARLTLRARF
ncbi:MAG: TonB-dependent siderophore receptor [Alphaproteobacteria bacterium]|nr:TonB-dependent siderophore receptor [Alphaproteobacteria bacterium]